MQWVQKLFALQQHMRFGQFPRIGLRRHQRQFAAQYRCCTEHGKTSGIVSWRPLSAATNFFQMLPDHVIVFAIAHSTHNQIGQGAGKIQ